MGQRLIRALPTIVATAALVACAAVAYAIATAPSLGGLDESQRPAFFWFASGLAAIGAFGMSFVLRRWFVGPPLLLPGVESLLPGELDPSLVKELSLARLWALLPPAGRRAYLAGFIVPTAAGVLAWGAFAGFLLGNFLHPGYLHKDEASAVVVSLALNTACALWIVASLIRRRQAPN